MNLPDRIDAEAKLTDGHVARESVVLAAFSTGWSRGRVDIVHVFHRICDFMMRRDDGGSFAKNEVCVKIENSIKKSSGSFFFFFLKMRNIKGYAVVSSSFFYRYSLRLVFFSFFLV